MAGFGSIQEEHVHESPLGLGGGARPAADQSNALTGGTGGAGGAGAAAEVETGLDCATPGRGASQTVHFSFALSGFSKLQTSHFHFDPVEGVGGFRPAAVQLNPFMSFTAMFLMSNVGREDTGASETAMRAFSELGPAGYTVSFTVNEYFGRSSVFTARASSCGESFDFGMSAMGCVSEGAGVVGGVNRDDADGRGAVGGVETAEEATTSTLST